MKKIIMSRRATLLGGSAFLAILTQIDSADATIVDANGNPVNASGPLQGFTGLNVSGGSTSTLTITSMPSSGTTSSTLTFSFSYTGSAPSGLTAVWQSGSISGTISGFTVGGGTGSATVTTPASAATYTLHITGTGSNTASATAPNTTVITVGPTITLASIPSVALTGNTVPITFTYTGTAPSGLTAVWQSGSVSGTVSGFTATGGSGSATITTPGTQASYTLTITGTGSNTASGTAVHTTVVSTTSTITITAIPSTASTSSTVSFNFTFTGTTPGGFTALWQSGSVSSTISNFSTAGSTGSATATTPASAATYTLNVTGTGSNTASASAPNTTVVSVSSGTGAPWPGQVGNVVGFAGAPGYPGSLTPHTGTLVADTTYNFLLFDGGTSAPNINVPGCTFNGCYFGASTNASTSKSMLSATGPITFNFCTFAPSPSVVGGSFPPMPPSGGGYTTWPTLNGNGIAATLGNDYGPVGTGNGVPSGGMVFNSCDIWSLTNGVVFSHTNGSNPLTFDNCWIHDPCSPPSGAHTDLIGDVQSTQSGDFVEFLTINHCTIAGVVNTNAIAMQNLTNYTTNNVTITNNYITSNGSYVIQSGLNGLSNVTNFVFSGNVFSAYLPPEFGIFYENDTAMFSMSGSGNKWRGNMILPGTYQQIGTVNSEKFLWPNATANTTDFTGAF